MILRQLSSRPPRSFVSCSSRTTIRTRQKRQLATSAEKRKWLREQGRDRPFLKKKYAALTAEDGANSLKRNNGKSNERKNWQPLFFLGVFPVFLSIVVVLGRDDLREEVNAKGIGRLLEDYKRWRRKKNRATNAPTEQHQAEQSSEYDKMLNDLELQRACVAPSTVSRENSDR